MSRITLLVGFSMGAVLSAQVTGDHDVPLRNWAAPLYWQPAHAESEAARANLDPAVRPPAPDAAMPVGSLVFVAMTPCRVVDTRNNCTLNPNLCNNSTFGPPSLSTNTTRSFPIQLSPNCPAPSNAMAYSFNVTMIPNPAGSFAGYVSVWNTAAPPNTPPTAATILDFPSGDIRSNAAIVPAGINNGSVSVITNATNPLDLAIDMNGYYTPSTGITLAQATASSPSLSFSGDAGTGIFSSAPQTLDFSTGGTDRLTIQSNGDLNLTGNIRKGGNLFLNDLGGVTNLGVGISTLAVNTGSFNTASGSQALFSNTSGNKNTASGSQALFSNTTGFENTASGFYALLSNTTGSDNTASGSGALNLNTTGSENTATGAGALSGNTTGNFNTASGYGALDSNSTGNYNTASGAVALNSNTIGNYNTASGYRTLSNNTTGSENTASGVTALFNNTTGINNTADGFGTLTYNTTGNYNTANGVVALTNNTTGNYNTASGFSSLTSNTIGNNNIAVGYNAGSNITGSYNIDIGNQGTAGESGAIRVGDSANHTSFFAAGIAGVMVSNSAPVLIDTTTGQLGTVISSRRYKEDIDDMGDASSGLLALRPVTYRYKKPYPDGSRPLDYGLIAEEVAEVYPDLVLKDSDGQIQTVQYHKLVPMLLNELQKQNQTIRLQQSRISELQKEHEALQKALEILMGDKMQSVRNSASILP